MHSLHMLISAARAGFHPERLIVEVVLVLVAAALVIAAVFGVSGFLAFALYQALLVEFAPAGAACITAGAIALLLLVAIAIVRWRFDRPQAIPAPTPVEHADPLQRITELVTSGEAPPVKTIWDFAALVALGVVAGLRPRPEAHPEAR